MFDKCMWLWYHDCSVASRVGLGQGDRLPVIFLLPRVPSQISFIRQMLDPVGEHVRTRMYISDCACMPVFV